MTGARSPRRVPSRVLQVVGAMDRGGAETMLMNVYRAMDRERIQFDFLTYVDRSCDYDDEIRALGGRVLKITSPRNVPAVARVLRNEGPFAAMHAHTNLGSAGPLLAAKACGVPTRVAHSHSSSTSRSSVLRATYAAWASKTIIATSTHLVGCGHDAGSNLFGRAAWKSRGVLIPNSVDSEALRSVGTAPLRRELGLESQGLLVGCVARMDPVKNHEFLIELAAAPSWPAEAVLVLIGDGPLRASLEARVVHEGMESRVRFLGLRTDVPSLMKALDVLVLPSHHEGLPMVLVEAQATATRCVVSTGVPDEADFGMGLVSRLPLIQEVWLEEIFRQPQGLPTVEETGRLVAARGLDSAGVARELERIYLGARLT